MLLSLITTAAIPVAAQRLKPVNKHINCGQVLFNSQQNIDFEIETKGKKQITIDSIETSCECIEVRYPKHVRGGKNFVISTVFNARMLGHFDKYLLIYTDAQKEPLELTFGGVVKTEIKDLGRTYPYEINGLRTDLEELEFDNVNKGDIMHQVMHIMNTGTKTVEPNIMHLPPYLNAEAVPEKLAPDETGEIRITLDSKGLHDYGLSQSTVYLGTTIGERVAPEKAIPVSAVLLPPSEKLSEAQKLNAPHIVLSSDTLDLGYFNGKSKRSGTIEISNTGKNTLSIKSLQLFTTGIQIKLNKQNIEPGGSAKLKITAVQEQLSKNMKPRILMITDDPDKSKIIIHIKIK